ncbi:hypothetical protein VTH06DRAFT_5590 [Thermothelomyces fergusii]
MLVSQAGAGAPEDGHVRLPTPATMERTPQSRTRPGAAFVQERTSFSIALSDLLADGGEPEGHLARHGATAPALSS